MTAWMTVLLVACLSCLVRFARGQTVTTNATTFSNRNYVNVSWSGIPAPGPADAVAAVIAGSTLNATVPLRYRFAERSAGYLTSGSGSTVFQLLNQRADIQFLFFSNLTAAGNFSQQQVIAASPVVRVANPNEPVQVHLALTHGGPSQMLVQWTTRDAGTPTVMYGTQAGALTQTATGSTTAYTHEQMCGPPANTTGWIAPGTQNFVNLSGLATDTIYFYKVGDPKYGMSQEFAFMTGPPVGPTSQIEVLINADPGHALRDGAYEFEYDTNTRLVTPPGSPDDIYSAIVNQFHGNGLQQGASLGIADGMLANSQGRTLAFFNGDLSYARGFATQWDVHFDQFQELASKMPVMVVEGNHERDSIALGPTGLPDRFQGTADDSGGECGIPTHYRYRMPTPDPVEEGKYWYSFNHGPVHYIQYSTELDYGAGSEQNTWIQADLKAVNRSVTPWIIANLHRPIYTTSISGVSQSSDIQGGADQRAALEDLFYIYGVDVTFCGHVHWYERTCPVYQKTCIPDNADGSSNAPVHITLGNGGQWLSTFFNPDTPAYLKALAVEHGYMQYNVTQTLLEAQMISSINGEIMDQWVLTKPANFKLNATARSAALSSFEPDTSLGSNWLDTYGIDGGVFSNITTYLLAILQQNPSLYLGLQDATLVQNVNGVDTLENTLQVLNPALQLLLQPQVQTSANMSAEAHKVIQQFFLPWYGMLGNGSRTNAVIMGQGSSATA